MQMKDCISTNHDTVCYQSWKFIMQMKYCVCTSHRSSAGP
jgi:hypothetical protein